MAKNNFDSLNDALFAQMERLANTTDKDALAQEIERSRAVSSLANNIISNANTAIKLIHLQESEGMGMAEKVAPRPRMLGGA